MLGSPARLLMCTARIRSQPPLRPTPRLASLEEEKRGKKLQGSGADAFYYKRANSILILLRVSLSTDYGYLLRWEKKSYLPFCLFFEGGGSPCYTYQTGESHLHLHPLLTFLHKEIEESV